MTSNSNTIITDDKEETCKFGSSKYYAMCGAAGILSCGLTHTFVVPIDIVKCRLQADKVKYRNTFNALSMLVRQEGATSLYRGWAPTLVGYSLQGLGKFGLYEVFKHKYASLIGEENSYKYRTLLYLSASASAEFFADILLCPMEAVKVRIQTQKNWATTLRKGFPMLLEEEGLRGLYKGIVPLWSRQIPYTIIKFVSFERILEFMYKKVLNKPRDSCSKSEQLAITFTSGYIAGIFCAIISNPADVVVSVLNKEKGSSAGEVLKSLGFRGIWTGLAPRIVMIGTLTALQWFIYDGFKVYFRLPRPPPPEMPKNLKNTPKE